MLKFELAKCYQCYYALWIEPAPDGRAIVSTCFKNSFRTQNRLILDRGLKDAWSSRRFQFQRSLAAKGDWGFCRGASCLRRWGLRALDEDPAVRAAAAAGKKEPGYFAKLLVVAPSNACDNACVFCFQARDRAGGVSHKLTRALIEEIKGELIPRVERVIVSGGEPFFAPEGLELIEWTISRFPRKRLLVMTNGAWLREFGLDRIMRHDIGLRISLYGMSRSAYRELTGRDRFDAVWRNINELMRSGHRNLEFTYLVTSGSAAALGEFCDFIAGNVGVKAIIQNSIFEGAALWEAMRRAEEKYSRFSERLLFDYRDETRYRRLLRGLYNPWHSLKYRLAVPGSHADAD